MNDADIIKALGFRRKSLDKRFNDVRGDFQLAAEWIDPARGRSLGLGDSADRRKQRTLIDSTPRKAYRILKSGLMGGMSSPSRPWFKLKIMGFEKPTHEVKVWLDEVQRRMYEVLTNSNAYAALAHCYGDIGLFGCYGGIVRGSFDDIIHVQSFPVGSYVWGQDDNEQIDVMHWDLRMTVREVVKKFGIENVSQRVKGQWERNEMNDTVDVSAAIEPRVHQDPMKGALATNMPVAMYYWEKNRTDKLLHRGGLQYAGILGPRWETVADDPWPVSSPGRDALGDVRQLQTQQRDKDTAIQMGIKPPMMGPASANGFSYNPGSYNTVTVADIEKGGPRPVYQVNPDLQYLLQGIGETQGRVMEAFFADLFRMASEYGMSGAKDVTATAIAAMQEEKLIVLGPVLESLDRGLLTVLVKACFHYMQEADILPPAPEGVVGSDVQVEFTSLLAQAQRAIGVAAIERTIGFAGTLAQMGMQGVLQGIDGDALLREFGDQVGFPELGYRDMAQVEGERQQAAQQEQMANIAQMAQPLAQSASLISEANARSQEALAAEGLV